MFAKIDERDPERAVVSREDGKFTVTFDRPPLLLFVSTDGTGTYDQLFINGEESVTHYAVSIDSALQESTVYHVSRYAFVAEGDANESV
ncbi:hypothetical protein ACQKK5_07870 [Brevibacillus panacihumi]|uniref:hypothetical protein n=1 Tax=Brevibacillus panacihumi TaxID=497735 RepID=UPI003D009D0E